MDSIRARLRVTEVRTKEPWRSMSERPMPHATAILHPYRADEKGQLVPCGLGPIEISSFEGEFVLGQEFDITITLAVSSADEPAGAESGAVFFDYDRPLNPRRQAPRTQRPGRTATPDTSCRSEESA